MKILDSEQIRKVDNHTIHHEPISSINLMERASKAFVDKFLHLNIKNKTIYVFCGTGNNGGDGLAISRLLQNKQCTVLIFIIGNIEKGSLNFTINLKKVKEYKYISNSSDFPTIDNHSIIVDGLFGSGLSRPIQRLYAELVNHLNHCNAQRVAIDISSGLYANTPIDRESVVFKADYTISFQLPKLVFFLPEYHQFIGKWELVNIGLDENFITTQKTNFQTISAKSIETLIPTRTIFTHKNKVGRLMIIAGSTGKMGAAVLCAKAAFKAGVGVVNIHSPKCGVDILQISIPEAMVSIDQGELYFQTLPDTTDTVVIGPGIGTEARSARSFAKFLKSYDKPLVIDADGINMLSHNKDLLSHIPHQSILTPHPGEFKRLVGAWDNDYDKLEKLRSFCKEHKINVVLKGAYSAVCNSDGDVYFNLTGNPGLATAGSGDVLAGIIGAFLAQNLTPFNALKLGVYIHGMAGDKAVMKLESSWIIASDIIKFIDSTTNSLSI